MASYSNAIIAAIQAQIDAASPILERIRDLRPVFICGSRDLELATAGRVKYDKGEVNIIENDIRIWDKMTLAVLKSSFLNHEEKRNEFNDTIVKDHVYYDAKQELITEVSEGVAVLNGILMEELMKMDLGSQNEPYVDLTEAPSKPPKVFISHSSKDKDLIQSFVEKVLVLGLGLNKDDIAFTSNPVYGIEPGEDIVKYIHNNIAAAEIVLIMISTGYKNSEVCLNEMGAAWALEKHCISVVLPDADFSQLGWLTSFNKAVRMNDKAQMMTLCQKMAEILSIDLRTRFASTGTYLDKFFSNLDSGNKEEESKLGIIISAPSLDDQINRSINKLGEFTIKELQEDAGILDYRFVAEKVQAMVRTGILKSFGTKENRKYKVVLRSHPLF